MARLIYIDHNKAERFDRIEIETVERWKDSELTGDEWRFSYVVSFYSHGRKLATLNGFSIEDCLFKALSQFNTVHTDGALRQFVKETFCCQPGCTEPWVVLRHPVQRFTSQGEKLVRDYGEGEVRAFCKKHMHRGDCGLDDNDDNYVTLDT